MRLSDDALHEVYYQFYSDINNLAQTLLLLKRFMRRISKSFEHSRDSIFKI